MTGTVTTQPASRAAERATWTCPNCRGETPTVKKRCGDCGTSRW